MPPFFVGGASANSLRSRAPYSPPPRVDHKLLFLPVMTRLSATADLPFSAFTIDHCHRMAARHHGLASLFRFASRSVSPSCSSCACPLCPRGRSGTPSAPRGRSDTISSNGGSLGTAASSALGSSSRTGYGSRLAPVAEPFRRQPTIDAWVDDLLYLDLQCNARRLLF